jgi:putative peptidoglycan lipid II flippase
MPPRAVIVDGIAVCGTLWGLQGLLGVWLGGSIWWQVAGLSMLIGVGVGIYVVGLQLLRLPEFTLLTGKLSQRFRKS